jgi:large subunit ribosomal protein L22
MAEEKTRRNRKAAEAETAAEAEEPKSEAAVEDEEPQTEGADAEEAPAEEVPAEEKKPARRRRGSAETTTTANKAASKRPDGTVVVKAKARYVRTAPRKARLVMDHIRGKDVERALAILGHTPRAVSTDILKLLRSAIANAESNHELGPDELRVKRCYVDEGPTIKRYRPRALGRATKINKRTSHMTIELTTTESVNN